MGLAGRQVWRLYLCIASRSAAFAGALLLHRAVRYSSMDSALPGRFMVEEGRQTRSAFLNESYAE